MRTRLLEHDNTFFQTYNNKYVFTFCRFKGNFQYELWNLSKGLSLKFNQKY